MAFISETARINRLISQGGRTGLTELEFFALEIQEWKGSEKRLEQITGDRYYDGYQDILAHKRMVIGKDGKLEELKNVPNSKIIDNQYAKMVDQKDNYLLGKSITFNSENEAYAELLEETFDEDFDRLIRNVGEDSLNQGLAWVFVYYNDDGELSFRRFPAYEILPFWIDDDHTILDCAVRLYLQEVWEGYAKKVVEKVEIYKPDGIYRYILDGFNLVPDLEAGEVESYFTITDTKGDMISYNWTKIPLIPFKYNKKEIPLIRRIKSLQDGINLMVSVFENNMLEDARNTILVIENYDGTELSEFRNNLNQYGAVKVNTAEGAKGGVTALRIEVNAENYKAILDIFKNALIENAKGYDAKDDRLSGQPNQMNIQSMYSDIDLDANGMEAEYQAALKNLIWFADQHFANIGQGDFEKEKVSIIFNRDILVNEGETIQQLKDSVGLISNETIVENHPLVKDKEEELKRIKRERKELIDDYANDFPRTGGGLNAK